MEEKTIKRLIKIIAAVIITMAVAVFSLGMVMVLMFAGFLYDLDMKVAKVGEEYSPDGRYKVLLQSVGEPAWPYGDYHAKVTVYDGKKVIKKFKRNISDDGGQFREGSYSIEWMPAVHGSLNLWNL